MSNTAHVLPDYLGPGLKIVFVGTAAGDVSARRRHYYAGPNNVFWRLLHEVGIVDDRLGPQDDARVTEYGVGLTDLVKDVHSGDDSQLSSESLDSGVGPLAAKLVEAGPAFVCFNGMTAYTAFTGRRASSFGLTEDGIGASRVFVVPSTSGRVSSDRRFDGRTRRQWFAELAGLAGDADRPVTPTPTSRDAGGSEEGSVSPVTLHEEIAAILRSRGNPWMTTGELAELVNSRGRYSKRDGSPVTAFQVHGRTRKYADLFDRDGSLVRLIGRPVAR